MKKILILIVLFNVTICSYGQIIRGTVSDDQTKQSIDYAVIYINGTFTGTQTDNSGQFKLDISRNPSMPITISALGYQSVIINNPSPYADLNIFLTPKIFSLDEVEINARESIRTRRIYMRQFKNQFLGQTFNANRCEILNENEIFFYYDLDRDVLTAYSSNPIIVVNNGLGYKVSYFMDQFEYNEQDDTFILTGNIKFDEDFSSEKNNFERRRRSAYQGSRMHFFRSLWNNELSQEWFEVRDSSDQIIECESLVTEIYDRISNENSRYLKYDSYLDIYYHNYSQGSSAVFKKDSVYFDKSGYFDILGISWSGDMSIQRIADQLPYEYTITNDL